MSGSGSRISSRNGAAFAPSTRQLRDRSGRVRRPARAVGLRQVDDAAPDRRARRSPIRDASLIAGRDVTHLPASKRNLSMVFQSYALFPHLTVAENIVFGLRSAACRRRAERSAAADRQSSWPVAICSTGGRASCRAGSSSASRSGGPSSPRRRSACSTSRCPISMRSCAPRCGARSARSSGAWR